MTEEEIKNLKVGDKFTVEYTAKGIYDSKVQITFTNGQSDGTWPFDSELLQNATLVKPAPTFEVGDTVRIVHDPMTRTIYGKGSLYGDWVLGEARILEETVRATEMKLAKNDGQIVTVNVHCLELVKKAVKDKFDVRRYLYFGGLDDGWGVCDKKTLDTIVYFACSYPNAEAAARDACDRLNAEWHEQQLTTNN